VLEAGQASEGFRKVGRTIPTFGLRPEGKRKRPEISEGGLERDITKTKRDTYLTDMKRENLRGEEGRLEHVRLDTAQLQ